MKLKFKYLLFMLVFLLMPVSNVYGFTGPLGNGGAYDDLFETARANSDIFFIRKKINFETCNTSVPSASGYFKKAKGLGGNIIILTEKGIDLVLDSKKRVHRFDETIAMHCTGAARNPIKQVVDSKTYYTPGTDIYDVDFMFKGISVSIPKELTKDELKDMVLVVLADTVNLESGMEGPESPIGLSFVSKFAFKTGDKYYPVEYQGIDNVFGVRGVDGNRYGAGVSIPTTVSVTKGGAETKDKKIAFLFQDLDQPDTSISYDTLSSAGHRLWGSFHFDEGAIHAESVLLYGDTKIANNLFYPDKDNKLAQILQDGHLVFKPTLSTDDNNFLVYGYDGYDFRFNWCGSNAQTAIGLLYFDTIPTTVVDDGGDYVIHACSARTPSGGCGTFNTRDTEIPNASGRVITHTSCADKTINLYDVYIKTDFPVFRVGHSDTTQCVRADVAINVVLTEDITFTLNQHFGNGKNRSIYAGGGFEWPNNVVAELKNVVGFKYQLYKRPVSSGNFAFDITPEDDYYTIDDDGENVSLDLGRGTYKETPVYSNDSCSSSSEIDLDAYVTNTIKDPYSGFVSTNTRLSTSNDSIFSSADPNRAGSTTKLIVYEGAVDFVDYGATKMEYSEQSKIMESYIDPFTAKVIPPNSRTNHHKYVDGGFKWYVPLKYRGNSVSVSKRNFNISRIRDNAKISATCSIPVKNILYEDGGGGSLKLAYKYRPVTLSNKANDVFPRKIRKDIPQNWRDWYCGDSSNVNCGSIPSIQSNRNRLANTYDAKEPLYSITLNSNNISTIRNISNDSYRSYASFHGMYSSGLSEFVNTNFSVKANQNFYCYLGVFDPGCNRKW